MSRMLSFAAVAERQFCEVGPQDKV